MKYKILHDTSFISLEEQVNNYLDQGYVLAGGVSVVHYNGGGDYYYQAVSKS